MALPRPGLSLRLAALPLHAALRRAHTLSGTLALPALLLLSFALGVWRLGEASLWPDEGFAYYIATQPLGSLFAQLGSTEHEPLHFLLLKAWLALAGSSEFSLRFPSVAAALPTAALTYALARGLFGAREGLLAALLLTLCPLQVWYAREVKMYTLLTLWALVAVWLLAHALGQSGRRARVWWCAYALASAAGLYTHIYMGLALAAQGAYLLARLWARRRRPHLLHDPAAWGLMAQGAAAALFAPWLPHIIGQLSENASYWEGRLGPGKLVHDTLLSFHTGVTRQDVLPAAPVFAALLVLALGAALAAWHDRRAGRGRRERAIHFLTLQVLLPAALLWLALSTRPKFDPRYLLIVLPPYCMLLARGALAGGRLSRTWAGAAPFALAAALLAAAALVSVERQFNDAAYAHADFRAAARYIAAHEGPADAVILVGGHERPAFDYYFAGRSPRYPLPAWLIPDLRHPIRQGDLGALNAVTAGRERVWLVLWQDNLADPAGLVLNQLRLSGRREPVTERFDGLGVQLFTLEGRPLYPVAPPAPRRAEARFGPNVTLVDYALDKQSVRPGDVLRLTLFWRADGKLNEDLTTFTQLQNERGHIFAQQDKPTANEFYPTSRWQPGDVVRDEYALIVQPGTPPGTYALHVGLYRRAGFERLPVTLEGAQLGQSLVAAQVTVEAGSPPGLDVLGAPVQPRALTDDLELLGYRAECSGAAPNGWFRLFLAWRARARPERDYRLRLRVLHEGREASAWAEQPPTDGLYPASHWSAGEIVWDIHTLPLTRGLPEGDYIVELEVVDPESGATVGRQTLSGRAK